MNKKEFLELLNSLDLPKTEYYILSSGALLLYGLRECVGDLDLCVSLELFEILKERYNLNEEDKNEYGFYQISKDVEFIPKDKKCFESTFQEGYPVQNLNSVLHFKEKRNAVKDKKDIENIKKYLSNL